MKKNHVSTAAAGNDVGHEDEHEDTDYWEKKYHHHDAKKKKNGVDAFVAATDVADDVADDCKKNDWMKRVIGANKEDDQDSSHPIVDSFYSILSYY